MNLPEFPATPEPDHGWQETPRGVRAPRFSTLQLQRFARAYGEACAAHALAAQPAARTETPNAMMGLYDEPAQPGRALAAFRDRFEQLFRALVGEVDDGTADAAILAAGHAFQELRLLGIEA